MSPVDAQDGLDGRPGRGGGGLHARLTRWVVGSPGSVWATLIIALLGVTLASLSVLMSRKVIAAAGQVMDHTRVARVAITVPDPAATDAARALAGERAPRVLIANEGAIDALVAEISALPESADHRRLEDVPPDVRERFALTPESLTAVRSQLIDGRSGEAWKRRSAKLGDLLRTRPLVDPDSYAALTGAVTDRLELRVGGAAEPATTADLLSTGDKRLESRVGQLCVQAGFFGDALGPVTARLAYRPVPTFTRDDAATRQLAADAAAAVEPVEISLAAGDVLYRRGERLTSEALSRVEAEQEMYDRTAPVHQRVAADAGVAVSGVLVALGVGAYLATFAPAVVARSRRLASLCGLFAGAVGVSCAAALIEAKLVAMALAVPSVFLAAVLVVAYERRTALAVGSLLAVGTALCLRQPLEAAVPALVGVSLMVWQLRELRSRGVLVRAGLMTGLLTAGVTLLLGALRLPLTEVSASQTMAEALGVGIGVLLVGFVVLGLLPTIERLFKVVTALSLIELRDPSHPLLRRLQQRAPGTYSHSMNVATLTETAARAIGADPLLAYVGALYHDVGKMNRPEFFVENQTGVNRHDKLPPAMSTLMIVSHVPDGLQLAREHGLPRPLHHFIESHHGTTVVEYFFRRAMKLFDDACRKEQGAEPACPAEGEYRYPGPKPRTKEVACVMVCDAAESTARTLADPSPVRIEQMVRAIADKRLADGQFDECELTMAELTTIVQTVGKSLAAIYHQRIVYPEGPRVTPAAAAAVLPAGVAPAQQAGAVVPGPR